MVADVVGSLTFVQIRPARCAKNQAKVLARLDREGGVVRLLPQVVSAMGFAEPKNVIPQPGLSASR